MKAKRLLFVCLALVMVAALVSAVACTTHTHEYTKWDRNETHHWKVCPTDGEIDESTKAEHVFVDGKCECGAEKSAPTPSHTCGHVCPVEGCGKCLDTTCQDPACASKCPGHEPIVLDERTYFLVGNGKGSIAASNWTLATESLTFSRVAGTNTYKLENITLVAGDVMKLGFNPTEWNVGDDIQYTFGGYFFATHSNVFVSTEAWNDNAEVAVGKDGIYNITLTTQGANTATTNRAPEQIVSFVFERVGNIPGGETPETDITGPINGIITHSSQRDTGAQITGTLTLNYDGTGYLIMNSSTSSYSFVDCEIEYTLANGVITITKAYEYGDSGEISVPVTGSGTVVGRTISITIAYTSGIVTPTTTEYTFESTLSKLSVINYYGKDETLVRYYPEGYEFNPALISFGYETVSFTKPEREGYTFVEATVNGDTKDAAYLATITSITEDTEVAFVWEKLPEKPKPQIPELTGKIIDYAGATDDTPVKYGFDSEDAAGTSVLSWTSTLGNNPVITIYSISIYWRAGIYTPQFAVSIGATGVTTTAATNIQLKLGGQIIKDKETANAALTIKVSDQNITIYLSKTEGGTRQILLVADNGDFVTWTAVASEEQPAHVCEHQCTICHGCLTESCQEEACQTKCQGHETHTYDGTYVLSAGTGAFSSYDEGIDKIIINGNTMTLYNGSKTVETITLTWTGNSATGEWNTYYEVSLTVDEYELSITFDASYRQYSFTFYADGHEPSIEIPDKYFGTWNGSIQSPASSSTTFDCIVIAEGKIQLHDSDYPDKWFNDGLYDVTIDSVTTSTTGKLVINISRSNFKGTITFTSDTTLTLDLQNTAGTTYRTGEFTLGETTEPGPGPEGPGGGEEGEELAFEGEHSRTDTGTGKTIIVKEIKIDTITAQASKITISGEIEGVGEFSTVIEVESSMVIDANWWYDGSKGTPTYGYQFTLKVDHDSLSYTLSFQYVILVMNDGNIWMCNTGTYMEYADGQFTPAA